MSQMAAQVGQQVLVLLTILLKVVQEILVDKEKMLTVINLLLMVMTVLVEY